jgi:hypothetical protein
VERLEYLGSLPWIGAITKYHAARNFGVDCVKPDIHLTRLAALLRTTPRSCVAGFVGIWACGSVQLTRFYGRPALRSARPVF